MKKNNNQILDKPLNGKINFLFWLILTSFLIRLIGVYFVRDVNFDNEWTVLLDNLIKYQSFSHYTFNGELVPSTFVPPIYPFFIYLVKIVTSF